MNLGFDAAPLTLSRAEAGSWTRRWAVVAVEFAMMSTVVCSRSRWPHRRRRDG